MRTEIRDRNYSGRPESYHEAKVRKASEAGEPEGGYDYDDPLIV